MRAMVIDAPHKLLRLEARAVPKPGAGEILIRVRACGVCRTDLHVVDGELPQARYPIVPGHEIVGEVGELGEGVEGFAPGQRVGVPWLGWTCGRCRYCLAGQENLCDFARFTGHEAAVRLRRAVNGRRNFTGVVRSVEGERVEFEFEGGRMAFDLADLDRARLVPKL